MANIGPATVEIPRISLPGGIDFSNVRAEFSTVANGLQIELNRDAAGRISGRAIPGADGRLPPLEVTFGARDGDGSNLALTLSQSYQKKVLVIDADLRRPTLHGMFGVPNTEGLTTVLVDTSVERLPVTQVPGGFWLLPAGRPDPNPMSLLTSDAMKQLLADASAQFDWVIVDTPPVGLMADANLLAAMVDAALIVVKAGSTPYPLVQKAVAAIGPARVLGVVRDCAGIEPWPTTRGGVRNGERFDCLVNSAATTSAERYNRFGSNGVVGTSPRALPSNDFRSSARIAACAGDVARLVISRASLA